MSKSFGSFLITFKFFLYPFTFGDVTFDGKDERRIIFYLHHLRGYFHGKNGLIFVNMPSFKENFIARLGQLPGDILSPIPTRWNEFLDLPSDKIFPRSPKTMYGRLIGVQNGMTPLAGRLQDEDVIFSTFEKRAVFDFTSVEGFFHLLLLADVLNNGEVISRRIFRTPKCRYGEAHPDDISILPYDTASQVRNF